MDHDHPVAVPVRPEDPVTAVYLAAFVVGAVAVLSALLFAEVGSGDGMPFLSLTGLSAAVLGAGAGGLIGEWAGLPGFGSALVAGGAAIVLVALLQGVLLPYLRRQEANSHRGRSSYIGLLGTVTLEVPPEGWGEVSFVDADGNRVRSKARSDEPAALPKSTQVYIADVDADYVHVVAVPDLDHPSERF
ncbi:NfeD family protein [Mycolicibacterium arseniciresistens]|uniref:NfeD family protein n=1 Tax=Mycolicibacterium arseniciresistens TaxID=3062257 RepID=UPI0038996878